MIVGERPNFTRLVCSAPDCNRECSVDRESDMSSLDWSGGFARPLCREHTRAAIMAQEKKKKISYPLSDKRNPRFAEEMARVQKLWDLDNAGPK